MNSPKASHVIYAQQIVSPTLDPHTQQCEILTDGCIAIAGQKIIYKGPECPNELIGIDTQHHHYPNATITPGLIDTHCFFTGYALNKSGLDPDTICFEDFKQFVNQTDPLRTHFLEYQAMLHARGVTAVKEMTFDSLPNLPALFSQLKETQQLTLKLHFMTQPVWKSPNIAYAKAMRSRFNSPEMAFSGFNFMTDGSIGDGLADLSFAYCPGATLVSGKPPDYKTLAHWVHQLDEHGFRCALHAQGDQAITQSIQIIEQCQKNADGQLLHRHAITDLELANTVHATDMARLGIVAELYPQISSRNTLSEKIQMIERQIGQDKAKLYWQRRNLWDSGVIMSCATDLPLLYPSLPEALYFASGAYCADGVPFNPEGAISRKSLIWSFTCGGAYNLGCEQAFGSLAVGQSADLVVYSGNLLTAPWETIRDIQPLVTFASGQIVYERLQV